jgi:murein DD-endopeptidase MepM/ murein hydrolase activator NlpD
MDARSLRNIGEREGRRWTVMLIPHGSGASRSVELSRPRFAALIVVGSVVALTCLLLGVVGVMRGVNVGRSRAVEHENQILVEEIGRIHERLARLRDTLNQFGAREPVVRLLAGLTPTDATVQQGGIGGPEGIWTERDTLAALGESGARALAARLDVDALARRAHILNRSLGEVYDSLSRQRERLAATPSIMPTKGWITSAFARERVHPILHLARPHEGIDVTAPAGAEIAAPAAGFVTDVAWEEGYGNLLTLDHGNGLLTRYAHCGKILVARGQRVKRGQKIALVGSTGLSTGPHLHYEVWVNGKPVDPMKYVLPDAIVD